MRPMPHFWANIFEENQLSDWSLVVFYILRKKTFCIPCLYSNVPLQTKLETVLKSDISDWSELKKQPINIWVLFLREYRDI